MKIKAKAVFMSLLLFIILFCLSLKGEFFIKGAKDGIILCLNCVLPSMLPFMFLSCFIAESGASEIAGYFLKKPAQAVFGVSGVSASVIIMSLIGGYPVGIKMACALLEKGKIQREEADRLNLFCMCGGPGFIIGTVGSGFYLSKKAGIILYLSNALACVLYALILRIVKGKKCTSKSNFLYTLDSPRVSFVRAAGKAGKSVLGICFYIVLFSSAVSFLGTLSEASFVKAAICTLEVTTAVKSNIDSLSLPQISMLLGFGGFCVHFQVAEELIKSKTGYFRFLLSRLFCAALSGLICRLILFAVPLSEGVFSNASGIVPGAYSVSSGAAVSLVISCLLLIFELDSKRKVW